MKKIVLIVVLAIALGVLFFGIFEYFVKTHSQKGALQVTSNPESQVYLNDKYLGLTPLCKCEAKDMPRTGDYIIRVVPKDNTLHEFQEKISISEGVLTVVDRKFGKDSLSEGSVISLSPLKDKNDIQLLVLSIPSKSKILLDTNQIGETPYLYKNPTESDHVLKVTKEGYKDKAVRIRTPQGYKLRVAIYLSTGDTPKDTQPTASPAASPTPTPAPIQVTILNTPTGFLRVRASASIGSAEIARVASPEVYDLASEQTGWYEIKLKDGRLGWISSQYASKK